LSYIEEDSCDGAARDEIFKKVIGEDKYGYAKSFSMVKVPRSTSKQCTLEEERTKRKKIKQQWQES